MASFWTLTSKDADQFKKGMKKRTDMPMHTMVFANIMQISKMPDRHLKYHEIPWSWNMLELVGSPRHQVVSVLDVPKRSLEKHQNSLLGILKSHFLKLSLCCSYMLRGQLPYFRQVSGCAGDRMLCLCVI